MGDTVITEKGITDKDRFYLPKNSETLKKTYRLRHKKTGHKSGTFRNLMTNIISESTCQSTR